jgi:UDP-GlcNAc:undecaprenyl-phosphate/decaprenyl-phosphate GlcNAc-1-phosphate transferase
MLSNFNIVIAIVGFFFAYRVSISLTRRIKLAALESGWVDEPNERSSHQTPIPRVGGLAIVGTFFLGILFCWALNHFQMDQGRLTNICHPVVLACGGVLCLVGLYDDRKGMSSGTKFFWQFAVACVTVYFQVQFESGYVEQLGLRYLPEIFSVLWIVGIINALNLIDGLDGLAAGVAGIAALFLLGAQLINGSVPNFMSGLVFLGALVGFLVFNKHPATIFMGDCGSLFLGYFLAVFALPIYVDASNYYLVLVPICALGLPIFDTLSAMTRRVLAGRSPFSADKEHLHRRIHRINRTKSGPYRRTVYSLYIMSVAFGTFGLVLSVGRADIIGATVVALLAFVAVLLYRYDYLTVLSRVRHWVVPHGHRQKKEAKYEEGGGGEEEASYEEDPIEESR